MTNKPFQLDLEALGKMVAEVGSDQGPGSSHWDAGSSAPQSCSNHYQLHKSRPSYPCGSNPVRRIPHHFVGA